MQAILANPEAAAELFRDPKRLQRLLEENPALISVLKSRLGKGWIGTEPGAHIGVQVVSGQVTRFALQSWDWRAS